MWKGKTQGSTMSSVVRSFIPAWLGSPCPLGAHRHPAWQTRLSLLSPGLLAGMLARLNNFLPERLPAFHPIFSWSSWGFMGPFCLCLLILCHPHPAHAPRIWALGLTVGSSAYVFSTVASFGDTTLNTSPPSPRMIVQLLIQ